MKEYLQGEADVLGTLQTDVTTGLSQAEAAARLEKNGPNKLKEAEKTPLWKRFLAQLADPMIIMLIVAAVISALTGIAQGQADAGITHVDSHTTAPSKTHEVRPQAL